MKLKFAFKFLVMVLLTVLQSYQSFAGEPTNAVISFTFDDGRSSVYTKAFETLRTYKFPATVYVITNLAGSDDTAYMNWEQISVLHENGWEIASHTHTHRRLLDLSGDEIADELLRSKEVLLAYGIEAKAFAPPYGDISKEGIELVKRSFTSSRRAWMPEDDNRVTNSLVNPDVFDLIPYELAVTTTLEDVKSVVDQALLEKKWLIFYGHKIVELEDSYKHQIQADKFDEIVAYIARVVSNKQFKVLTVSQVLGFDEKQNFAATRKKAGKIVLGKSKIVVPNNALVATQVDRVIRDIAWTDSVFDERVDPGRIPQREQLVPYMEGRLSGLLVDYAQAKIVGLGPTVAKRRGKDYFAPDANGDFVFRVDPSKVTYKTASSFDDGKTLQLPDTHGFNMIASEAVKLKRKSKLFLVVACMDLPAKAKAALYLARKGINAFGPCDRFAYKLLGYKLKNPEAATIIGTAPIRKSLYGAVIGNQSIEIDLAEPIVVQNTDKGYPDQYCDTARRYFEELSRVYNLKLDLIRVDAGAGEARLVVAKAKASKAKVIGVRVWNKEDAEAVAGWLQDDPENRAVLFHSAAYEDGYDMFFRFPKQTSFGDLNPIIKEKKEVAYVQSTH